jgi:hypothetical protein
MAFDISNFKGPGGVNVAECLRVADLVERSNTFDMGRCVHMCGTPACIAGHAMTDDELHACWEDQGMAPARDAIVRRLGITEPQSFALFNPSHLRVADWLAYDATEPGFITAAHAAACLRKLAATGEVDWLGTKPEGK